LCRKCDVKVRLFVKGESRKDRAFSGGGDGPTYVFCAKAKRQQTLAHRNVNETEISTTFTKISLDRLRFEQLKKHFALDKVLST